MKRRDFLASSALFGVAGLTGAAETAADITGKKPRTEQNQLCFNTACILHYDLPIEEELAIAAKAGFPAVEVWMTRVARYVEEGKSLAELKRRIDDLGLRVVNGIGFAEWIVNDDAQRAAGLATMRTEMERLAELGCPYIAAPAAGPWKERIEGTERIAERFRAVLALGDATGVRPMLELWGTSPTFSRLSDVVAAALATGRSDALLLLDAYHLFRGGNTFDSLALLNGQAMPLFHLNDWPDRPREELADKDRVFPGDGVAPLPELLRRLNAIGFRGPLSLEIFNPDYQSQMTPEELARTGFKKMRDLIGRAEI